MCEKNGVIERTTYKHPDQRKHHRPDRLDRLEVIGNLAKLLAEVRHVELHLLACDVEVHADEARGVDLAVVGERFEQGGIDSHSRNITGTLGRREPRTRRAPGKASEGRPPDSLR